MEALRRKTVTTALVGLLVLGGAACTDDNGETDNGGDTEATEAE